MVNVVGKSGYPCFEGRILEAEMRFRALNELKKFQLEEYLEAKDPDATQKFAQQWLYVLCRLAARCVPLPTKNGSLNEAGEEAGLIRICSLAPGDLLCKSEELGNVFFPVKEKPSVGSLPVSDYRLFIVLDCKSRQNTKNCNSCQCKDCDGVNKNDAFGSTTIAILHEKYIALPTEDAQMLKNNNIGDYKVYLAWYLKKLFPSNANVPQAIKNLMEICGKAPTSKPVATLPLTDDLESPKSLTVMAHM